MALLIACDRHQRHVNSTMPLSATITTANRNDANGPEVDLGRVSSLIVGLAVKLAQLGLEHLAVIVLRQRFEKDITARPLESRDR
jgi:hypothetical protein